MSIALEFFSIDLDVVQRFFSSGDSALSKKIVAQGPKIYHGDTEDDETKEQLIVWEEIVSSIGGGRLGQYLASLERFGLPGATGEPVSEAKALVIVSVIRHFGEAVGATSHSQSSGDQFRSEPFSYLNQIGILGHIDANFLLSRPLFGQTHPVFPDWGGLSRDELASFSTDPFFTANASSGDTDVDSWVRGILNSIEEAQLRELDLVTVYS